ncbi:hypothetical protein ABIB25_003936 [Nakamurella sp. UYEF19]
MPISPAIPRPDSDSRLIEPTGVRACERSGPAGVPLVVCFRSFPNGRCGGCQGLCQGRLLPPQCSARDRRSIGAHVRGSQRPWSRRRQEFGNTSSRPPMLRPTPCPGLRPPVAVSHSSASIVTRSTSRASALYRTTTRNMLWTVHPRAQYQPMIRSMETHWTNFWRLPIVDMVSPPCTATPTSAATRRQVSGLDGMINRSGPVGIVRPHHIARGAVTAGIQRSRSARLLTLAR